MASSVVRWTAPAGFSTAVAKLYSVNAKTLAPNAAASYSITEDAVSVAPAGMSWYEATIAENVTGAVRVSQEINSIEVGSAIVNILNLAGPYWAGDVGGREYTVATVNHIPIVHQSQSTQPSMRSPYKIDFSDLIGSDTLATLDTIVAEPSGELAITTSGIDAVGYTDADGNVVAASKAVEFQLSTGGIPGELYRIQATCTTAGGDTEHAERNVVVE